MFAVTLLGTSASVPSADRNHPGLLVEAGGDRVLVDCGEGTQRQLLRSGAGFRRLDRLLLTHAHFDHVLGIPGLLSTLRLQQSADTTAIHGGPGTLEIIAVLESVLARYPNHIGLKMSDSVGDGPYFLTVMAATLLTALMGEVVPWPVERGRRFPLINVGGAMNAATIDFRPLAETLVCFHRTSGLSPLLSWDEGWIRRNCTYNLF